MLEIAGNFAHQEVNPQVQRFDELAQATCFTRFSKPPQGFEPWTPALRMRCTSVQTTIAPSRQNSSTFG
jgi:hypothetical protein